MAKHRFCIGFILLVFAVSACSVPTQLIEIRGSGVIQSETRQVKDIDSINLSGIGSLTILQSDEESLEIQAEDNLIKHLESVVRGGKLYIGAKNQYALIPTKDIQYTLKVKNIRQLEVSGLGYVYCSQLNADTIKIISSGSSQLKFDSLVSQNLFVEIDGAGIFKINGVTEKQNIFVSGAGAYDAGNLRSQNAEIEISGAGSATLWVESSLEVKLSGATSLRYYGKPIIKKNVSGISRIEELGIHP